MAEFNQIPEDPKSSPFLKISQDAITLLESLTPAEKGQAVPYVKIWEIDPGTGKPVGGDKNGEPNSSISFDLVRVPLFGASVKDNAERFRERPPVSLERVGIKSEVSYGLIMYRQFDFSFMVHKPDVLFEEADGKQVWTALIIPGRAFMIEYGWSASNGVKNGLINGLDHVDEKTRVVVPSRVRMRFTVTNYSFQILADNQIRVSIQALDDGEHSLRQQAYVVEPPPKKKGAPKNPVNPFGNEGLAIVQKMYDQMRNKLTKKKGSKGTPPPVEFKEMLNQLFAPVIEQAFKNLGYGVTLYVGNFNSLAGSTIKKYGNVKLGGKSLGTLPIPVHVITKYLGDSLKVGSQPTLNNFLVQFMRVAMNPEIFHSQEKTPNICMKVVYANKAKQANVYIFDAMETVTKFDPKEKIKGDGTKKEKREALRKKLADKGIPLISFLKGNSYIQDAQFEVQADDKVKSIFMFRHSGRKGTREEKVSQADAANEKGITSASRVMYSNAIVGELRMLGNFAFDVFGLVWVDFGVPTWSGPFFIMGREEIIERGNFTTVVKLQSSGDDPLGSQAGNF